MAKPVGRSRLLCLASFVLLARSAEIDETAHAKLGLYQLLAGPLWVRNNYTDTVTLECRQSTALR
jgi:hypothetical protein